MIEVKCPFYVKVPHAMVPPHYLCQVNGLMEILDRDWCDFVSWTPTAMRIYRVYRDPELWSYLLDRYVVFYSFMKAGCSHMPRVTDRSQVHDRLEVSEAAFIDYKYWSYLECPTSRVSSPPPLSDATSNDGDNLESGTQEMADVCDDERIVRRRLCKEDSQPSKLPRLEGDLGCVWSSSDSHTDSTSVSGVLYDAPEDPMH